MKKIKFSEINIEGFGSIVEPFSFKLNQHGLNLIKGENGFGKTTIFSALMWCLYGENLKGLVKSKIPTWKQYRSKETWRGTRVSVLFHVDDKIYMLARHINYKGDTLGIEGKDRLLLFEKISGTYNIMQDLTHIADVENKIVEFFGLNSKAFLNSIIFGQKMKRLIEADPKDNRELFETLFDAVWVEEAKKKGIAEKDAVTNEIGKLNLNLSSEEALIEQYKNLIKEEENRKAAFDKEKHEKLTELNNNRSDYEKKLKEIVTQINLLEKKIKDETVKYQQEFEADKKERLENYNKEKTELEDRIKAVEAVNVDLKFSLEKLKKASSFSDLKEKISGKNITRNAEEVIYKELTETVEKTERELKKAEGKKDRYSQELENVTTECPTCSQPLKKEDVDKAKRNLRKQIKKEEEIIANCSDYLKDKKTQQSSVKERMDSLDVEINKLQQDQEEAQNKYQPKLEEYNRAVFNLENLKNELTKVESNIEYYTNLEIGPSTQINELEKELDRHKQSSQHIQEFLDKCKEDLLEWETKEYAYSTIEYQNGLNKAKKEAEKISKTLEIKEKYLGELNFWLKTGFGANGLKNFIFSAMLTGLNQRIKEYADILGLYVKFSVDLTSKQAKFTTDVSMDGITVDYNELSGGEKQKINIVLAFAMHDLVNLDAHFNILIMDEVFEGLSQTNIELAFQIIRKKAEEKAVFVVTHSPLVSSQYARNIYVSKEKGRTYIETA